MARRRFVELKAALERADAFAAAADCAWEGAMAGSSEGHDLFTPEGCRAFHEEMTVRRQLAAEGI